jgi:DNA-binding transcriptional LysR family regulator
MAANHPLTQYDKVPWAELAKFPQVVFKDGYGMQRLVQAKFQESGGELQAALELNTLDAFRGVVRQGNLTALLPQSALTESRDDPTLAIRATENPGLTRRVVLVTTCDRLNIPIIRNFCQLVLERGAIFLPQQQKLSELLPIEKA